MPQADTKELLSFMIKNLVQAPDEVEILESSQGDLITYKVEVRQSDIGRVIGKGGKTANALRAVVNAAATRDKKRVNVEFAD